MSKYIDLTTEIYDGAPTMPMDPKCAVSWHCNLDTLGYNLSRLTMSTHQGTHIDAPKHFFDDGETIDKIELERVIVNAIKVDLTHKKDKEPIVPEDLKGIEGNIKEGMGILLHTGWDKRWPEQEFFSDFPFISIELANWLADKKVGIVGMDMPTPNGTAWKVIHEILLRNNVLVVEGLCNMESITEKDFLFLALPLKIKDRDGSPIRAIAIQE